jgi:ABC-2 type transport system permease protein
MTTLPADLALAARQLRYEQRSFWRNRSRAFFAFLLPLMFLVIFASMNHGARLASRGGIAADAFVIPGLLAYGVIMATFANLASELAAAREDGLLKRMHGTPLPGWAFVAGRVGSAVVTAAALTGLTLLVARLAYGVPTRLATAPGLLAALVVGTACFSALGIGVNRLIPNADAAPAIANALILPLTFVSGVWGELGGLPAWMHQAARAFPVQHLAHALQVAFDPRTHGPGLAGGDLAVLALWGALGAALGIGFLRQRR